MAVLTISMMLAVVFDCCMARPMDSGELGEDSANEDLTTASPKKKTIFEFWAISLIIGLIGILIYIVLFLIYYVMRRKLAALKALRDDMLKKSERPKEDEMPKAVREMMESLTPPKSLKSDRERSKKEIAPVADVKKQEIGPNLRSIAKIAPPAAGPATPKTKSTTASADFDTHSSSQSGAGQYKKKGPYVKKQPMPLPPIKKQSVPPSPIKKQPDMGKDGGDKAKDLLKELTGALTAAKKEATLTKK